MQIVKLNDGTEMRKIVAERVYSSLRNFFNDISTRKELMAVVRAFLANERNNEGLICGHVSISEIGYYADLNVLHFQDMERAGLITDFELDKDSIVVNLTCETTKESYSFNIPKSTEAIMRNTLGLVNKDFIKLKNPTKQDDFAEQNTKTPYKNSRW